MLLDDGTLSYYASEDDVGKKSPKGRILLAELLPDSPCLLNGVGGGFSVSVPGRIYEFMAESTAVANEWIFQIKGVAECLATEED